MVCPRCEKDYDYEFKKQCELCKDGYNEEERALVRERKHAERQREYYLKNSDARKRYERIRYNDGDDSKEIAKDKKREKYLADSAQLTLDAEEYHGKRTNK